MFQDILSNYCVDYKGCIEKSELQRKVFLDAVLNLFHIFSFVIIKIIF